jgi:hypothetical protein
VPSSRHSHLLFSQLYVCHYNEASSQWPDLLQPPSDRIDDDELDVQPLPCAANAQLRAGGGVRRQELKCFACGEASGRDRYCTNVLPRLPCHAVWTSKGRLPESAPREPMHRCCSVCLSVFCCILVESRKLWSVHVVPLPRVETTDAANEAILLEALSSLFSSCGQMYSTPLPALFTHFVCLLSDRYWLLILPLAASTSAAL